MDNWQVPLMIEAMAIMVEVEAMKMDNEDKKQRGEDVKYDSQAFWNASHNLNLLANSARGI